MFYIELCLFIFFLFIFLYNYLTKSRNKTNHETLISSKNYKEILKSNKNITRLDLTTEDLDFLGDIFGKKLKHLTDTMKFRTDLYFQNNIVYSGYKPSCVSLEVSICKLSLPSGELFFALHSESHFGQPAWYNKEMHYNYPIEERKYYFDHENAKKVFFDFIRDNFKVDKNAIIPIKDKIQKNLAYFD